MLAIRWIAAALMLTLAGAPSAWAQTPPAAAPTVMIVFDGSGSMWGRLENEKVAKFVTVREALKPLIAKADPTTQLALTTFGSRRQGDCTDATVAIPPEPGSGEKLVALLERYNPKGKSPLTLALREAVKAMPKAAGPRSLILIHDDFDNCGLDPCAALADIQASGAGLAVHTIGIGLRPEDSQRLQCLTGPTGGKLYDGQSQAGIAAALEETLALASLARPVPPAPVLATPPVAATPAASALAGNAAAATRPSARPALRTDGRPGVRLATVLAAGQPPRTDQPQFMVRRADAALDVAPAFVGRGQDLQVALAPGAYVVEARDGLVTAPAVTFTIPEKGQVGVDVPLQAGLVRLPAAASAVQSNAEATITVFERSSDGAAAQAVALIPESDTEGGLALLPGRYVLRFAEGNLRRDQPLDVRVGEPAIVPGPWPFGRLQIAIGGAADIASEPVAVTVYEDDPEAPRGRREVARSAAVTPDLALPAGTYTVVVRQGRVEARDRLSIAGGQVVRRTLALAGARLTVMSRVAGLPPAATNVLGDEPVSYRLERLDVVPPEVFTAHRATAEFGLPAGRYRVEARHGLVNARVSREVTLAAGETITLTLDQPAGIVRLAGPPRAGELLWELLDDAGDPLWSSAQTSPRITLRAGRYVVRLETREKRIERRFEVRAGEVRTVDVAE